MPLYYFTTTTSDGAANERDEPLELSDRDAAWAEATVACGEIIRELDGNLSSPGEWRLDVRNEAKVPLFSIRVISEVHSSKG